MNKQRFGLLRCEFGSSSLRVEKIQSLMFEISRQRQSREGRSQTQLCDLEIADCANCVAYKT
jgi:hypothetical protein